MSLYINIRLMRQKMSENHMTYTALADKSEVSVSTIKRILPGTPNEKTAYHRDKRFFLGVAGLFRLLFLRLSS